MVRFRLPIKVERSLVLSDFTGLFGVSGMLLRAHITTRILLNYSSPLYISINQFFKLLCSLSSVDYWSPRELVRYDGSIEYNQ